MNFTGTITEISVIKTGENNGKEWASLDFEVTELNPQNENYPQVALFGYFKNGDYVNYAKDFNNNFKVGDVVTVEFNLKCVKYKKDGEDRKFYKTECWKLEKADGVKPEFETIPAEELSTPEEEDLPF